jgi:thioredoxin-related protein
MKVCEDHYAVVVYSSRQCPICDELGDLKAEIMETKQALEEMKQENRWQASMIQDMERTSPEAAAVARLRVEEET